jgi:hypothetical protein
MAEERRFPWGWVLGGCGCLVIGTIVVIAGAGFWAVRQAKHFAEDMKDPQARAAKVERILGAETLPEGYHPVIGFSIPFFLDLAVLGDRPLEDGGHPQGWDKRGFIFVSVVADERNRNELDDFVAGRRSSTDILRQHDIDFDAREDLGRGSFEQEHQSIRWAAYRGDMENAHHRNEAIVSLMAVGCPHSDKRIRMGIWFVPDPNPEAEASALDLRGTAADEDAMNELVGHFRLCPSE